MPERFALVAGPGSASVVPNVTDVLRSCVVGLNRGFRYRERVGRTDAPCSLLDHLAQEHRHSSRDEWDQRIRRGEVHLGNRAGRADLRVHEGDEITWDRPPWEEADVPRCCAILYSDAHVLVVAKPRGLPTVPAGGFLENTLLALVRERDADATPMHRLGRGTSGLVVFGRTKTARSGLARSWRDGAVERIYRGLVEGIPSESAFTVETRIGLVDHAVLGSVYGASEEADARHARTEVRVVASQSSRTVVEVEIGTGRPDQIRIHLAAANHPLVGDPLYGVGGKPRPGSQTLPGEGGYWLHAARLSFPHPISRARVVVECAPPPCLR